MPYKDRDDRLKYFRSYYARPEKRAKALIREARRRRPDGLEITEEWALERLLKGTCEVSGIPFVLDGVGQNALSPSIDRIDSSIGYTRQNSRLVVWLFNVAKGQGNDATAVRDIKKLAKALCTPKKK